MIADEAVKSGYDQARKLTRTITMDNFSVGESYQVLDVIGESCFGSGHSMLVQSPLVNAI